jgi:putative hydrolase of the HAD superfamily
MIKGIKHIILDLGGVVLNIDYSLTQKAFIELGIENFAGIYSQLRQTVIFDELEAGKITETEFILALQKAANHHLDHDAAIKAWNAMILDFPRRRMQMLQQLRLHYDLLLLSNTNIIHEACFNKILMHDYGMPSLIAFFDKVYFSHRLGIRKPMPEIYQMILNENEFEPERTLFIDDGATNIEAAKALGLETILLDKGMTIEDDVFKKI